MRYKEFKERVEAWGQKYNISTLIEIDYERIKIKIDYADRYRSVAHIDPCNTFSVNLFFFYFNILPDDAKEDLFKIITELAATDPKDRKDEKRFIIPLPSLVTTDGEQQYLTQNGSFFASRWEKRLKQTWKEEHLKFVPDVYRQFAVELDEELEELEREIKAEIGRLEEKYYLRSLIFVYDNENYLNLERDTGKYLFGSKKNIEGYQTKFTMEEIEKLKEIYNLDSFEIVEED